MPMHVNFLKLQNGRAPNGREVMEKFRKNKRPRKISLL